MPPPALAGDLKMIVVVTGPGNTQTRDLAERLARRLRLPVLDAAPTPAASGSPPPLREAYARGLGAGDTVIACGELSEAERDWLEQQGTACGVVDFGGNAGAGNGGLSVPGGLSPEEAVERAARALAYRGYDGRTRVHFAEGSADTEIDERRARTLLEGWLRELGALKRVLLLPPDFTRLHSGAGPLTVELYEQLTRSGTQVEVLPATGTHLAMSERELRHMFPGIPPSAFRVHDFRNKLRFLGEVPGSFVREVSQGRLGYPIRCELDAALLEPWDRIISVGQLVPHEVIGIANHTKNVFVGTGGKDIIDRTHFLGAVCNMERIMGRARTPVRDVLEYMAAQFGRDLPLSYLLTVRAKNARGELVTRGLYAGDDIGCFTQGAELARQVNLDLLEAPIGKAVVYLDPEEFKSTWLGNKAIYRTRMALADRAELVVLAPGVRTFGEDPGIDALIRRHGYRGTEATLAAVEADPELAASLSAAAHLIHGSSEGRFQISYAPGALSRSEVEGVGFRYLDCAEALGRYTPDKLRDGWNRVDGEDVFFISNPALGLWALKSAFTS